jgi:hypothetical protein
VERVLYTKYSVHRHSYFELEAIIRERGKRTSNKHVKVTYLYFGDSVFVKNEEL